MLNLESKREAVPIFSLPLSRRSVFYYQSFDSQLPLSCLGPNHKNILFSMFQWLNLGTVNVCSCRSVEMQSLWFWHWLGQTPAPRPGENILIFWNNDILRGNRSAYQLCFILVTMTWFIISQALVRSRVKISCLCLLFGWLLLSLMMIFGRVGVEKIFSTCFTLFLK